MSHCWLVVVCGAAALGAGDGRHAKKPDAADAYLRQFQEPGLARELCVRFQSDQAARKELIDFQAGHNLSGLPAPAGTDPKIAAEYRRIAGKVQAEDEKNLAWLKGVVAEHGWPGKSLVGLLSAQNAWLLVQHADADREFQKACLDKMGTMPKGEVEPTHLAYLTDRVLLGEGKKQKYGTQTAFQNRKVVTAPIEDEGGVDERRKALGLEPLSDYLAAVEKMYAPSRKSDPKRGDGKR